MGFTLGRWNIHSTKRGGKSRLRVIRPYVYIYTILYRYSFYNHLVVTNEGNKVFRDIFA